ESGPGANPATESAPAGGSAPVRSAGVIPSGTPLHVRVDEAIDTRRNRAGDQFSATLSEPIEVDGRIVVPYRFKTRQYGESKLDLNVELEYLYLLVDKLIGRYVPTRFALFVMVGSLGVVVHLAILALLYILGHKSFT